MCRLSLMNRKGMERIEKEYGLELFFDYLEAQLGGHGNGYLAIDKHGNVVNGLKGVQVFTTKISKEMLACKEAEWFVFHTRLASMGAKTTSNCHPFWNEDLTAFLCANGTERTAEIYNNRVGNETDTETVFKLGIKNGASLYNKVKTLTAVYIGKQNNKLFAVRNLGALEKVEFPDGGIVLASSFPYGLRHKATVCDEFVVEFPND